MSAPVQQPRCGGFSRCFRGCDLCSPETHHFSGLHIETAEGDPEHDAAKLGVSWWWRCRHCDTWIECLADDDFEEGPDLACLATLPAPPRHPPRRPRPTLTGDAEVHPAAICKCGHRADSHYPELPSPCAHGRTMPNAEIIYRACDPTLLQDPRYGCRCIAFSRGAPS